jgi:small subunit ribosomal protein S3
LGRKVHPLGFRLGIIRDWQARWYADKPYPDFLQEDLKLRNAIKSAYPDAAISQVQIERQANEVFITISTARPGIVIGRGGQRVDETRVRLEQLIGKRVRLNIQEVAQPELDAYLVARTVADQIEHRIAYRRAMKQALFRTSQAGARGMKITCSGRLGGAEIARRENLHEGRVPLHTLRADIDYGFTEARTPMGRLGVKVWIYKGDILPEPKEIEAEEIESAETAEEVAEVAAAQAAEEPVAVETAEAPPEAEAPAEPVPTVTAEAPATAEEKPAKPRRRRTKAAAEAEAPAEPVAAETAEAPPAAEEKPTKPKRSKVTKAKAATTEEEEKDATTQAGEVPQES